MTLNLIFKQIINQYYFDNNLSIELMTRCQQFLFNKMQSSAIDFNSFNHTYYSPTKTRRLYESGDKINNTSNPPSYPNKFMQFIATNQGFHKNNKRYLIRNSSKHPRLKIIDKPTQKYIIGHNRYPSSFSLATSSQKKYNYNELKALMCSEIEKLSLSRNYENFLQKFSGSQFAGELRSQLAFRPNHLPKFSKKKQHYPKAKFNGMNITREDGITVQGTKVNQKDSQMQAMVKNETPGNHYQMKTGIRSRKIYATEKTPKKQSKEKTVNLKIKQEDISLSGWGNSTNFYGEN